MPDVVTSEEFETPADRVWDLIAGFSRKLQGSLGEHFQDGGGDRRGSFGDRPVDLPGVLRRHSSHAWAACAPLCGRGAGTVVR